MIRKKAKIDPLRLASKDTMQRNSSKRAAHIRSPAIPRGPPRRSRTGVGKDLWPTRSSLTLPK